MDFSIVGTGSAVLPLLMVAGGVMAFAILHLSGRMIPRAELGGGTIFDQEGDSAVFLFDDEDLVDASNGARQLLAMAPGAGSAWSRLVRMLRPRFPDLDEEMSALVDRGELSLTSTDGQSRIDAEWRQGLARLSVIDLARHESSISIDRMALDALEGELNTLRGIARDVPYLTWKETDDGRIVWANASYLAAADRAGPARAVPAWPPHRLFPAFDAASVQQQTRHKVEFEDDGASWFDLTDLKMEDGVLRVAMSADTAVRADQNRTEFIHTLTKTFATLSVGLAIFDRARRLVLFNPALTDLTGVPVELLAQRPRLVDFIDHLRDRRVLPEPKDFGGWRHRISTLEAEARQGTFAETWTLPDGQVFEVTGRPHPDGAIALLIQDVSAEIRLTRRFRSELQMNQAVLDSMAEGVALFGDGGQLLLSNQAYDTIWGQDARLGLQGSTLTTALRQWQMLSPDCSRWNEITRPDLSGSKPLEFSVDLVTGRHLHVRVAPLAGGTLLVGFTETRPPRALGFESRPEAVPKRA